MAFLLKACWIGGIAAATTLERNTLLRCVATVWPAKSCNREADDWHFAAQKNRGPGRSKTDSELKTLVCVFSSDCWPIASASLIPRRPGR